VTIVIRFFRQGNRRGAQSRPIARSVSCLDKLFAVRPPRPSHSSTRSLRDGDKTLLYRSTPIMVSLLLLSASLSACDDNKSAAQTAAPPAPQVTVAKPVKKLVSDFDEYVGRFVAVDFVEVRARVSGYLDSIHFTDGQLVKAGDPLFTIDRRPFQAALDQAQAAIEQAKANLAFAESDLKRGEGLVRGSTITQQTFDQRTQAKRVAEANVTAQEAATRQADLDLTFTQLTAPISGRIGDRRVSIGNLVTGGT